MKPPATSSPLTPERSNFDNPGVLVQDTVLDGIQFHPGYTENDAALETFARAVDGMEVW